MNRTETRIAIAEGILVDLANQLDRVNTAYDSMINVWLITAGYSPVIADLGSVEFNTMRTALINARLEMHIFRRNLWRMDRIMALLDGTEFNKPAVSAFGSALVYLDGSSIRDTTAEGIALESAYIDANYRARLDVIAKRLQAALRG